MTDSTAQRRPLWLRLLIGASFALNVLVIGAVIGLIVTGPFRDDRPPLRPTGVAPLIGLLPPQERGEVFSHMRALGRDIGVTPTSQAEARQRIIAAVAADPFDPEALVALLTADQERFAQYSQQGQAALAAALTKMSPAERKGYAERLERFDRFKGPGEDRERKDRDWHKDKDRD